jgi:hypothetical protein
MREDGANNNGLTVKISRNVKDLICLSKIVISGKIAEKSRSGVIATGFLVNVQFGGAFGGRGDRAGQ